MEPGPNTNMLIEFFFQGFSITKTKQEQLVEEDLTELEGGECSNDEKLMYVASSNESMF